MILLHLLLLLFTPLLVLLWKIISRFCVFDHCQSFGGVTVLHALASLRCCYFTGANYDDGDDDKDHDGDDDDYGDDDDLTTIWINDN